MGRRVRTGIAGFDSLVEGGFHEGFIILVSGTPGTGKTLFGLEYLYNGAKKFREKGMFITLEQKLDELRAQASAIGLNLKKLEKNGSLTLMHVPVNELNSETIDRIKSEVKKRNIKR